MADLAKLVVRLEAESSKLHSELQSANRKLSQFGKNTASAMGIAQKAIVGLSAAVVVGRFTAMVREVADLGDQLNKFSQKVGISVEKLSALQYSADLADVSTRQLETGLVKLNRTLGTSGEQGKKTRDILEVFGITSTDTADVVVQLADRFSKMEDGAVKTAAAVELFGKSGAALIPLLNSGADAIREQEEELRKLGALMGKDAAQASEKLNDNMTRLGTAFTGIKLQIVGAALPAVNDLVEGFVKWLSEGDRVIDLANRIKIAFEAMGVAIKVSAGFIAGGLIAGLPGAVAGATAMGVDEIMNRMGVKELPKNFSLGPDRSALKRMQDRVAFGPKGPSASGTIVRTAPAPAPPPAAPQIDPYTEKLRNLGLAQAAAAKAAEGAARAESARESALKAAIAAQEQARQRIADYVAGLQEEADTIGMSRAEITSYQLAKMGASEQTQKFAAGLAAQIEQVNAATEAEKKWQEVRAELSGQIDDIVSLLQTETESIQIAYARRMQIVEQALEERLISESRAVELINGLWEKQYAELEGLAEKNKDAMTKFAEEAAGNIQNAMADTFFNWMQGEFSNLGAQFKAMLDRMVANALAAKLAESLFGAGFGSTTSTVGGLAGKLIPMVSGLFGGGKAGAASSGIDRSGLSSAIAAAISPRANGGPVFPGSAYLVGENGPELFSPASAGSIIPNAGGGVNVVLNISGITDARGIREASGQMASRAGVAVQRAVQRNT